MTHDRSDDAVAAAQDFYTRWARHYDALARNAPWVRRVRADAVARLAPARGDTVVEMGCGTGANVPFLREAVGPSGTVVGVDFSPGVLERARARVDEAGWDNVHVVRGDATRPPVDAADRVLASFVVGMLDDPAAVVAAWCDLVRPAGRVALFDLARTTRAAWRPLNLPYRLAVAASSPPGTRRRHGEDPARVLDRRVTAAHRSLLERCREASGDATHETRALGFVRISAGRV